MKSTAYDLFVKTFENDVNDVSSKRKDHDDVIVTMAPGRVNIIGEHTDYNHGFVMPAALELATWAVARLRKDKSNLCRIVSAYDPDSVSEFALNEESLAPGDEDWSKYVKGVVKKYFGEIIECSKGNAVGFEIAFASNVPLGGGLSSSASLEVCTAITIETLYSIVSVSKVDRALRCVEAEHEYANVPCGIMDQFVSSCAEEGFALLIDCRSKETTKVALSDSNICIVVTNSNKKHQLSGSEYPDRVKQCKEAVELIQKAMKDDKNRTHLRDCTIEELEKSKNENEMNPVVYKRALHGISEDIRTLQAVKAAETNDYELFGKLMNESHASLRDNYEVSIPEIDFLVDTAQQCDGVYGSRITGGGFGGCTVTLVKASEAENLMSKLSEAYKRKFDLECTCFSTNLGKGASVLDVDAIKKAKHS